LFEVWSPIMREVTRREALRHLAVGGAAAATAPLWVQSLATAAEQHSAHYQAAGAAAGWTPQVLNAHQNDTVVALAERIIPRTDTPGATDANVNRFIDAVLADGSAEDRQEFLDSLAWLDTRSQRDFGRPFAETAPDDQVALLTRLSQASADSGEDGTGRALFDGVKSLTITGFYTSEIGIREEIGHDGTMFFAEFKGCQHPEHQ
jgi:hypothetical protein